MEFNLIRKETIKKHNLRMPKIETEKDLKNKLSFYGKSYKGDFKTQKKKLLSFVLKRIEKAKEKDLSFISEIEKAEELKNPLIITIEWKKSRVWGKNPKAFTNYGFEGSSVGGCGYCKHSTATAQALNSHKAILKELYKKEEKRLKELKKSKLSKEDKEKFLSRRAFIGYGSGYFSLPKFEGGVGVHSHEMIIKNLGFKWENITSTSNVNVYRISK